MRGAIGATEPGPFGIRERGGDPPAFRVTGWGRRSFRASVEHPLFRRFRPTPMRIEDVPTGHAFIVQQERKTKPTGREQDGKYGSHSGSALYRITLRQSQRRSSPLATSGRAYPDRAWSDRRAGP